MIYDLALVETVCLTKKFVKRNSRRWVYERVNKHVTEYRVLQEIVA